MTKRADTISAAAARRPSGSRALPARTGSGRVVRRRPSFKKVFKTGLALGVLLLEIPVALGLIFALGLFWKFSTALPNIESLAADIKAPVATKIWSQDGVMLGKLETVNRQPVKIDDVPKDLINATVAIEDHRFFEHPGVDVQGIARAAYANFHGGGTREGASTLTQQLVRNVNDFGLTKEKRLSRKIREAMTALWVEKGYSKNEILQLCFNNFYYGAGAYGIQAASLTYFGKSASKLTLPEAALLAGLPQRPADFTPFYHRRAALKRRGEVLDSMARWGYITPQQADVAKDDKPKLMPPPERKNQDFKAPYFVTYVLKDLFKNYGAEFVYSGLKIDTTLNYRMQRMAERTLENGIRSNSGEGINQGALISIDQKTGYIRAMVGGRNFRAEKFNAVTQGRRQPGSTFKVFDYSAAFDTGACGLDDAFEDKPIPYPNHPEKVVKNYGGGYSYEPITCRTAIAFSKNTIAVQVAQKVGIKTVIAYAHKMGINTPLVPVLPTALGASEVRPLDLCSAYTVFPMQGSRCVPMGLVRVTDSDGTLLEEHIPQMKTNLLKPTTISQMDEGLQGVVEHGSGTAARSGSDGIVVEGARGKTGTTSDSKDAWFAGYTPELTTVVWVANVHMKKGQHVYRSMGQATGGHVCAPIWHDFMVQAVAEQKKFKPILQASVINSKNGVSPDDAARLVQHNRRKPKTPQEQAAAESSDKDGFQTTDDSTTDANSDSTQPGSDTNTDLNADGANTRAEAAPNTANAEAHTTRSNTPAPRSPETSSGEPSAPVAPPVQAAPAMNLTAPAPTHVPRPATRIASALPSRSAAAVSPAPVPAAAPLRTRAPRIAPRPAPPAMVSVNVCVDSGGRATEYCPAFRTVSMTRAQASRLHRCRQHRPPPGEG